MHFGLRKIGIYEKSRKKYNFASAQWESWECYDTEEFYFSFCYMNRGLKDHRKQCDHRWGCGGSCGCPRSVEFSPFPRFQQVSRDAQIQIPEIDKVT